MCFSGYDILKIAACYSKLILTRKEHPVMIIIPTAREHTLSLMLSHTHALTRNTHLPMLLTHFMRSDIQSVLGKVSLVKQLSERWI